MKKLSFLRPVLCAGVMGSLLASPMLNASADPSLNAFVITHTSAINPDTNMIEVEGRVGTQETFTSLDINGYAPSFFDGEFFSFAFPSSDAYRVNLYGDQGEYQTIDYAAPTTSVDSALQVVIGHQLMSDLGPVMGRLLADLDLNPILGIDPNSCALDTFFLSGCDLYIKELAIHGTPDVALSFSQEGDGELTVNIAVDIPKGVLHTKLKRALWWGYRDTTITTENIDLEVQIGIKPTDNQSVKLVLNEASDVNLSIGKMKVKSNALSPYLIPLFKDAIAAVIDRHAANAIGPFLGLLPIPAIPLALPIDIDGDEVNDAEFAINMHADTLSVLSNNDGMASLSGTIASTTVYPGREILGSRRLEGSTPEPQAVTDPTDIHAALAVDLVNQVLAAVYQSGLEKKLALPMTVEALGDFGKILVGSFGYQFDDDVMIRLGFGAVPEMLANSDSEFALGIDAAINEMQLIISKITEAGEVPILELTTDVLIDTSLGAEADGSLHLEFTDLLSLSRVEVTGGSLVDVFNFPPVVLAGIVEAALPNLVTGMEPAINDLLNVARLELDIGEVLNGFLNAEFPSVMVEGFVTETGVSTDNSYINLGLGLEFPQ